MKNLARLSLVLALALGSAAPLRAQGAPDPNAPPPVLTITREVVRVGKNAAHEVNEQGWAGVLAKAQWPTGWLGTTAVTGPNEAWYFTGYPSWEAWEKDTNARDAAEALAETRKYAAQDGELLNGTFQIVARYRPALSYQPNVTLGQMRYFTIDTVRVKPGRGAEFAERWRDIVAAHEKAKMDEHWAVYQVEAGAQAGTFMFIYARKSLADLDTAGPMHGGQAYRDAMGEAGRAKNREMDRDVIEFEQTNHYAFSPKMSYVPKAWVDADPAFWTPKPVPAPATKKPAEKKP